jgi:Carboxypeptidase regulatory-like domain/TonB-dependent Receptor Plug Domain
MRFFVAAMCALAIVAPRPAEAQRTTGELVGTVSDSSNAVLPGVTVTLHGPTLPSAGITAVTTATGTYRFPNLPPGTYSVEATLSGFSTVTRTGIQVGVGAQITLPITMSVGNVQENVTVTGATPVVSVSTAQVSTTYDKQWVESAPVPRFTFFDLVNAAPGMSQTNTTTQSTANAQSMGSSVNANSYLLDGTDISAPGNGGGWAWPNTDAIDQVEVMQLGASAEYGNVEGAVINIITREGGNQFHGDGNFYSQSHALTSRNTTDAQDGGFPYYRKQFTDTTWQLSGPFVRDKLWFFGSYQYQNDTFAATGFAPSSATASLAKRLFYKLTWQITPKQKLMHGMHDDYWALPPNTSNPLVALSTLSFSHGDNPTPNFVYDYAMSASTYLEARYSGYFAKNSNDPYVPGQLPGVPQITDEDTGAVTGGVSGFNSSKSWRRGASIKIGRYIDQLAGGSHDFKFGVQYNGGGQDTINYNNDTISIYSLTGRQATGTTQLPYHSPGLIRSIGTYVDDTYKLSRLTFNLGVRYDYSYGLFQQMPLLDANSNETGAFSPATGHLFNWKVVSPRIGVDWQVDEAGKTAVKAHYGRYYRGPLLADFSATAPGVSPIYTFNIDAAGNRSDFQVTSSSPNLKVDPNYRDPYTDQIVAEVQRQLVPDLGLEVDYVHKSGHDYPAWVDTTGQYAQVPYIDSSGTDATNQPITVYKLLTPVSQSVFLMTNAPGLHTRYNGVAITATKRMSQGWQGTFSLVLSKSTGRLPSSTGSPSSGQGETPGSFGRFPNGPNDLVNSDGRLIGDRPVVGKIQFMYQLPYGFLVSTNIQHQTGRPWARQIKVSGLGFAAPPTIYMEPLDGSRRLPSLNIVDMRVQKSIPLNRGLQADLFADILNLTNSTAPESVISRLGTSKAFGAPTSFQYPRRVMLGAKIRF